MSVMIVFTCPSTGRDISVGVLPKGQDLATRRDDEVNILCLECGQRHSWKYRDGRLAFSDDSDERGAGESVGRSPRS